MPKVVKLHLYYHNFWNTYPKWIKLYFFYSSCHVLSKNINFIWFLGGPKFDLMPSLWRQLANLHKFLYSFEKTIKSYWSMPNFKSISFKMAVLQEGGQNLPSPCVCYPKDPMWNRVKNLVEFSESLINAKEVNLQLKRQKRIKEKLRKLISQWIEIKVRVKMERKWCRCISANLYFI